MEQKKSAGKIYAPQKIEIREGLKPWATMKEGHEESERLIGNQKEKLFWIWSMGIEGRGAIGDESRCEARGGRCRGER